MASPEPADRNDDECDLSGDDVIRSKPHAYHCLCDRNWRDGAVTVVFLFLGTDKDFSVSKSLSPVRQATMLTDITNLPPGEIRML